LNGKPSGSEWSVTFNGMVSVRIYIFDVIENIYTGRGKRESEKYADAGKY
jgi:hypothetical protein